MFTARNLKTKELIDSIQVGIDPRYQNCDRTEWVIDIDAIENWDEVIVNEKYPDKTKIPVIYVKEKKYYRKDCDYEITSSPYFALPKGLKEELNINIIPESHEHKLVKNFFFNQIKNNCNIELVYSIIGKREKEITINLNELPIDYLNISIEKNIKSFQNLKRADLYIPFLKKHNLLGQGIVFEIQLSNQKNNQTNERSLQRALKGFSTCWIFKEDLIINNDSVKLKNPLVVVHACEQILTENQKKIEYNLKSLVEQQERLIQNKLLLHEEQISFFKDDLEKQFKKDIKNILDSIEVQKITENKELLYIYDSKVKLLQSYISCVVDLEKYKIPKEHQLCPSCKDGQLRKKKGKYGYFLGCSNFVNSIKKCEVVYNIGDKE